MKRLSTILAIVMLGVTMMMAQEQAEFRRHGHDWNNHDRRHHREEVLIRPLSGEEMETITKTIKELTFDDKKLSVAKMCVMLHPMTVSELSAICKTFSFEDRRIEFLVYAYDHCLDRENYYLIKESLTFSFSYDKIMKQIHERKND